MSFQAASNKYQPGHFATKPMRFLDTLMHLPSTYHTKSMFPSVLHHFHIIDILEKIRQEHNGNQLNLFDHHALNVTYLWEEAKLIMFEIKRNIFFIITE